MSELTPEQRSAPSSAATARCWCGPAPAPARRPCWSSASCRRWSRTACEVEQVLAITFTEKAAAEMRSRVRRALPRARPPRGRARRRGRLGLDDPRLLRARAARPRAQRRHRPGLPRARRARGGADRRRRVRRRARGVHGRRTPSRIEMVAAYTPDRLRRHGAHRLLAPAQPRRSAARASTRRCRPPPAGEARAARGRRAARRSAELGGAGGRGGERACERGDRERIAASWRPADSRPLGGNAKALCTDACDEYRDALAAYRPL